MAKISVKLIGKSFKYFAISSTFLILTGCGGGGSSSVPQTTLNSKKIVGYLVDSAVVGAEYKCGDIDDYTKNGGKFECKRLPVEFFIGGIRLGEVKKLPADKKVYPQDLLGIDRNDTNNEEVKKLATLIQSFDEDKNATNGIYIPKEFHEKFKDEVINLEELSLEELKEEIQSVDPEIEFVPVKDAISHLKSSLGLEDQNNSNKKKPNNQKGKEELKTSKKDKSPKSHITPRKIDKYAYIPKGDKLTDAIAIRFLNKATFGATQKDIQDLRNMGVEAWVEKQLNMPLKENEYLIKTIELAKEALPDENPYSIKEYLEDNDIVFNKNVASFFSPRFMESAWFDIAVTSKDQLRQKVAYALSQIIVESDFEPIFIRRGEALSRYFDILAKNALGNYKQLLTDISFNSGMSLFLTFNGSKKLHQNEAGVNVYPDENYAREIMQLFSIGLNELNLDGTPKRDSKGNLIPTYTQEDVNELSRVFTGWDLKRNERYGLVGFTRGDFTHPVEFTAEYHDFGEKKLLGKKIPAGLSGEEDVKAAIDIIMSNPNVAPFISKNLIMRLTKSNPSPAYVQRVASVFRDSNGDLKKVVKAILLDPEIWDDIKNLRSVKFKEPLIAYISVLKRLNVKPLPYWYFCRFGGPADDNASNCTRVHNKFLFNDPRDYLGQGPGRAPTVFNFYDNSFVPNDPEFKANNTVAPEVQIQDDTTLIKFSNKVRVIFNWEEINMVHGKTLEEIIAGAPAYGSIPFYYIGADKFYFNLKEDYDFLESRIDGDTDGDFKELKDDYQKGNIAKINKAVKEYIDFVDKKLTGGLLKEEEKEVIYQELTNNEKGFYNHWAGDDTPRAKIRQIIDRVITPLYRAIITSDKFMTE